MTATTSTPVPTAPTHEPDITIRETRVYRGPNYYSYEPAVHLVVDIGRLEEFPTDTLPGFTESLIALLPGLQDHQCSRGRDGGFVERLVEGTWAGHVVEHVALELERTAGHEITRGKTRSTGEDGVYNVIYGYLDETVGTLAGRLAVRLVNHLVPGNELAATSSISRRARRIPADLPAGRLRPVHPGDPGRGHRPRHPLAAAEFRVPGAARARGQPAPDPGHHDVADVLAGRRHRLRQGADQPAAGRGRPAGADVRGGPPRRRRGADGPPDRLPRRAQAAGRQPRSRRRDQPDQRGRGTRRIRGGLRPVPARLRAGRVVHHRQGLPGAGGRRAHDRDRRAGAGARHRRRGEDGRRTGGDHQRRPAPRRRAREGAHPHRGDRRRRSNWSATRATR